MVWHIFRIENASSDIILILAQAIKESGIEIIDGHLTVFATDEQFKAMQDIANKKIKEADI